jgi:hypothetical protein
MTAVILPLNSGAAAPLVGRKAAALANLRAAGLPVLSSVIIIPHSSLDHLLDRQDGSEHDLGRAKAHQPLPYPAHSGSPAHAPGLKDIGGATVNSSLRRASPRITAAVCASSAASISAGLPMRSISSQ